MMYTFEVILEIPFMYLMCKLRSIESTFSFCENVMVRTGIVIKSHPVRKIQMLECMKSV